jgi:hypothetical protein
MIDRKTVLKSIVNIASEVCVNHLNAKKILIIAYYDKSQKEQIDKDIKFIYDSIKHMLKTIEEPDLQVLIKRHKTHNATIKDPEIHIYLEKK